MFAEDVELAESVSIAMLTVLETLAPMERAVFVLHQVFDMPHAEIAPAAGKSRPRCSASEAATLGALPINVETHRPLDLLDDRAAEVFANWLRPALASRRRGHRARSRRRVRRNGQALYNTLDSDRLSETEKESVLGKAAGRMLSWSAPAAE
jgi:hypothetical protein